MKYVLFLLALLAGALLAGARMAAAQTPDEALGSLIDAHPEMAATLTPPAPPDPALVTLGRELFFSKALSGDFDTACASCHHPRLGGGDGLSLSVGVGAYEPDLLGPGRWAQWRGAMDPQADGAPNVPRNAPSTFNALFYRQALFHDGRVFAAPHGGIRTPDSNLWQPDPLAGQDLLEAQARFPPTANAEMLGFRFAAGRGREDVRRAIAARLRASPGWLEWFRRGLGQPDGDADTLITFSTIQRAISAYQQSQIAVDHAWSAYLKGDTARLDPAAKRGALLFFRPRDQGGADCASCHRPPFFSDEKYYRLGVPQFGRGKLPDGADPGRFAVTGRHEDWGRFRTPSLLNVALTGPYGHDGAYWTLEEMIAHHLDPARARQDFDFSFSDNPQLRHVAQWLGDAQGLSQALTSELAPLADPPPGAVDDLAAFLRSLTDPRMKEPAFLDRFVPDPGTTPPDEHRLVARFGAFGPPPQALRPAQHAPKHAAIKPATSQPVQVAATLVSPDNCMLTADDTPRDFGFDEIAQSVGLDARHAVSWPLYTLASAQRMLFSGGVATGDVDGNCLPDIYMPTGNVTPDRLYLNFDGRFKDVTRAWGLGPKSPHAKVLSNGAALVDIDGDDDLDLAVSVLPMPGTGNTRPLLYRNDGGRFVPWPQAGFGAPLSSWSFAFADYDADGDLDALSTHWRGPGLGGPRPNHLWENTGTARAPVFRPADIGAGLRDLIGDTDFTFTGTFADIDADGWPDILMASDFGTSQIYRNLGNGRFSRLTPKGGLADENGMGAALADYDNDGDLDWFVSSVHDPNGIAEGNWGVGGNRLYRNDGEGFAEIAAPMGVSDGAWGWGACFADFNNDGRLDLFHATGFDLPPAIAPHLGRPGAFARLRLAMAEFEKTPSRLFLARPEGGFDERAAALGIRDVKSGRGVVCFDYDRDGDIDILVSNHQDRLLLYRNRARQGPHSHFITIALRAPGGNSHAIGARVFVSAGGQTQMREIRAGGAFLASAPQEAHFGLGDAVRIERVRVIWPAPGSGESVFENVPADQFVLIRRSNQEPPPQEPTPRMSQGTLGRHP